MKSLKNNRLTINRKKFRRVNSNRSRKNERTGRKRDKTGRSNREKANQVKSNQMSPTLPKGLTMKVQALPIKLRARTIIKTLTMLTVLQLTPLLKKLTPPTLLEESSHLQRSHLRP